MAALRLIASEVLRSGGEQDAEGMWLGQPAIVRRLRAFALGIREYREVFTTNPGEDTMPAYDAGRELAHMVTLRRHEP